MKKTYSKLILFVGLSIIILLCSVLGGCDSETGTLGGSKPKEVTVTLDVNGGTGVVKKTLIGKAGDPMSIETPTREDYEFYGWCNGMTKVDVTTFPDNDITLTARYYASKDTPIKVTDKSTPAKVFTSNTTISFTPSADEKQLKNALEYLEKNSVSSVTVAVSFDAYYSTSSLHISLGSYGYVSLRGHDTADIVATKQITNINGYETFSLSKNINPNILSTGDSYINIVVGSNNSNFKCYTKNINIEISYIEKQGTIV